MILIADSGSSKTDWRLISRQGNIEQVQTAGFNPFYQHVKSLDDELQVRLLPQIKEPVSSVYYYGAGCSTEANRGEVHAVLSKHFDDAHIEVHHDLLAAARSLCGHESGIACILGTGVNSCLYDGAQIIDNVTSLGYVLGDEGSGASLGKMLLADYLRKDLPPLIRDRFMKRYELDRNQILEKVYQGDLPGRFLASFSKFIFQNINDPYCYRLVYNNFTTFFEKNVVKYDSYKSFKVHFTGSVAFYFNNILRQVGHDMEVSIGNVVESPIAGLTLYHKNTTVSS